MHCVVVVHQAHKDALMMSVSAMLCFLLSLKPDNETYYVYMLAIISLVLFGLWSVRDLCHIYLVEYFHALFCHVKFL